LRPAGNADEAAQDALYRLTIFLCAVPIKTAIPHFQPYFESLKHGFDIASQHRFKSLAVIAFQG
jgi:hypothetical protein